MSIDSCGNCGNSIDTDFDLECYVGDTCLCENCRDKMRWYVEINMPSGLKLWLEKKGPRLCEVTSFKRATPFDYDTALELVGTYRRLHPMSKMALEIVGSVTR
jgi:hypothetical protein